MSQLNVDTLGAQTGTTISVDSGDKINNASGKALSAGLELLSANTVSGSSSTSVDNIFSSTYTNYKVFMNIRGSHTGVQYLTMKLRTGGSDNSSSLYTSGVRTFRMSSDAEFEQRVHEGTDWKLNGWLGSQANNTVSDDLTIYGPAVSTRRTQISGNFITDEVGDQQTGYLGGSYEADTAFDGLSIIALGGTWSGQINIYGIVE